VRRDIPIADQIVQVGHACFEAGQRWPEDRATCHLVLIGVTSQDALLAVALRCESRGIRYVLFDEPDDSMGYTALCTEPLDAHRRVALRRYALWA